MSSDPLPFPQLSPGKIEQIVKAPTFTSSKKKFGVVTYPLTSNLEVNLVPQEHIWVDKKKVYGYLRQLHPYPEIRGAALDEINGADVAMFDVYRIPKPGHCPAGLQGVVYDLPAEISQQTPLSLELVDRGKELIIESWPPSYPRIPSPAVDLSPHEQQHQLQLEGPPPTDDEDVFSELLLPDGQELVPSSLDNSLDNSLLDSPNKKGKVSTTLSSASVASALGGMIDDLHDEVIQDDEGVEVFNEPEVFSSDVKSEFPAFDDSLPPIALDEFTSLPNVSSRKFEVRNNGTLRFVVVNRIKGETDWKISPWSLASQVINETMNACYSENLTCTRAFQWANPWKGAGLISLFSSFGSLEMLHAFRRALFGISLDGFTNMEFNTFPKDLLPTTKITVLLKTALKNFSPRHIPSALFNQNPGLSGSLKLHSVKPIIDAATPKFKKRNLSKDGWRIVTLKGNLAFFSSLKRFPEAHPFPLGCAHVHIRGGTGRFRGGKNHMGRGSAISVTSSSSSSSSQDQIVASVVVPSISQADVVVPPQELNNILASQESSSSGIIAAAMAAASSMDSSFSYGSQASQSQDRGQSSSRVKVHIPVKSQSAPKVSKGSVRGGRPQPSKSSTSASSQSSSASAAVKSKSRGRGRGFSRDKKFDPKKKMSAADAIAAPAAATGNEQGLV